MEELVPIKPEKDSSSNKAKIVKLFFDAAAKSLLDIEMMRCSVYNYSGFIRAKIFKYPLKKIQISPEEINPIYSKLPESMKEAAEFTNKIDLGSLSRNLYEIISSYSEVTARYNRDCNSTLIRNGREVENVIDNLKLDKKFKETNYRMGELQGKFHAFFDFVSEKVLKPYGHFWPKLPEYIEEKLAMSDDQKTVPLKKFYSKIVSKKFIGIKFNSSEFEQLEKMKEDGMWGSYSGLIRYIIFGKQREFEQRVREIIYTNSLAEQVIILTDYSESLASKIKYSAYKYEKKMDEMKADPKSRKYRREMFVMKIILDILKEESYLESMLNYFLAAHDISYTETPYDTGREEDEFEKENDYELAKRLDEEDNKNKNT